MRQEQCHRPAQPVTRVQNLPLRTLLRIAHHRRPGEATGIGSVLRLADLTLTVQRALAALLGRLGLSDTRFTALIALYTFDPDPVGTDDLASLLEAGPALLAGTIGDLVRSGHIERHATAGRRHVRRLALTHAGRRLARRSIDDFLESAARISRELPVDQRELIAALCTSLESECRRLDSAPHPALSS